MGLAYQFTREQSASAELSLDYEDVEDFYNPDGKRHLLASVPLQYVYDSRDDKLNPTKGFRALAFAEPTHDFLTGASFVKLKGELSAYQALDEAGKFVLAGRVGVGSIFGAEIERHSGRPPLLCRRRRLGARLSPTRASDRATADGEPTGGRSLVETSVEMRITGHAKRSPSCRSSTAARCR